MANIKSAKKRIKVIETKTLRNKMIKSALKTTLKKYSTVLATGTLEEAKAAFISAGRSLDMAASKGVLHANKASRTKSRLAAKLNAKSA